MTALSSDRNPPCFEGVPPLASTRLRAPGPPAPHMDTDLSPDSADVPAEVCADMESRAKLDAISRVMAIIEFELDGTILHANENFLHALGYSASEIVGANHSLFVEPDFAASAEYEAHWNSLRAGEAVTGRFRRVSKTGQDVWIQASYNPIFDESGTLYKIVKYATDVTDQVQSDSTRGEFIEAASAILHQMAAGDLTAKMTGTFGDEMNIIRDLINDVVENVSVAISAVMDSSAPLASAAEQLSATSTQLSTNSGETNQQATSVEEATRSVASHIEAVASGTEELSASIREIAQSAASASVIASGAVDTARETNATVSQLGVSSQEIGQVIKVITSIAQQTNLLALNATIEAARAGEAGKGFAVVANEVKELAKETARATDDIGRKIVAIQAVTQESVSAIENISEVIGEISDTQGTIAAAVEQQTATTNEMARSVSDANVRAHDIVQGISGVVSASGDTSLGAEDVRSASSELARMAAAMQMIVTKFSVS